MVIKFLCELFDICQGIAEISYDMVKIFKAFRLEVITGDNGIYQAAGKIVQYLRKRELIKTVEDSSNVRLTYSGLDEDRKVCKD